LQVTVDNLTLNAETQKDKNGNIIIEGKILGSIEVECIKCLNNYQKEINEVIKFKVVKPPYSGFDEEYDIIEQEKLDLKEILKSEIESIKSDYNICCNCENKEFNQEF
jgi:uncharacterized metal-binding protein YceD (DUF177 family)